MEQSKRCVLTEEKDSPLKRLTMTVLGLYIASLYVLAYSVEYNIISRMLFALSIGLTVLNYFSAYNSYRLRITYPTVSLLLLFAYSVVSCLWVQEEGSIWQVEETLLLVILLYLMVKININTPKDLHIILKWIYYGAVVMCLYTAWYYGIGEIISNISKGVRIGGEINQENSLGFFCALLGVLAVYQILLKKNYRHILVLILDLFIQLGAGSRRGILMFIVGTVVLFIFVKPNRRWTRALIALSILIVGISLFLVIAENNQAFARYVEFLNFVSEGESLDGSLTTRLRMIVFGLTLFISNPLFGYGTLQYEYHYMLQYGHRRPPHNNYVEVLVNYGLIGFSLLYGIYVSIAKRISPKVRKNLRYSVLFLALFVMLLLNDMGSNDFLDKFKYLILALMSAYAQMQMLPADETAASLPRRRKKRKKMFPKRNHK